MKRGAGVTVTRADVGARAPDRRRRVLFLGLFVVCRCSRVFAQAFEQGLGPYCAAITDERRSPRSKLTLLTAAIAVPLNVVFGVAAAWLIAKYDFFGKSLLITLIDLPFSVSPVISGLIFVLLFGAQGVFGPLAGGARHQDHLRGARHRPRHHLRHASRSSRARCCRCMQSAGQRRGGGGADAGRERLAGCSSTSRCPRSSGACSTASSSATRARWASSARSRSSRATSAARPTRMPLQVEILYNEYNFVGAFAVASLLTLLALRSRWW